MLHANGIINPFKPLPHRKHEAQKTALASLWMGIDHGALSIGHGCI